MLLDLDDDEVSNLRWLLQSLGVDITVPPVPAFEIANTGKWAASVYFKMKDTGVKPVMSLDDLREALGRFAADSKTAQEVDDLRALLDEQQAMGARLTGALAAFGLDPAADIFDDQVVAVTPAVKTAIATVTTVTPTTSPPVLVAVT